MTRVLVVEDSNLMQAVIGNFIKKEKQDVEVLSARDGEEAIRLYTEARPAMVFMDIKMPGMDGLTALERIRAQDPGAKVVMCTALKEQEQKARARKAGAKGYITKPFSRDDIVKALNENL